MKINDTVLVSEWNQAAPYQRAIPEAIENYPTEMANGFGVLHIPESVEFAHGRLTDRASRMLMMTRSSKNR